jgi:hypothetical protein
MAIVRVCFISGFLSGGGFLQSIWHMVTSTLVLPTFKKIFLPDLPTFLPFLLINLTIFLVRFFSAPCLMFIPPWQHCSAGQVMVCVFSAHGAQEYPSPERNPGLKPIRTDAILKKFNVKTKLKF